MAVIQLNVYSQALGKQTEVGAVIPFDAPAAAYPGKPGRFRPVYLLHGYSSDHTEWLVNSTLQELAQAHGLAFIMPDGDKSFYLDNPVSGERFEEYVSQELPQLMNSLLPLSQERSDITIGGLSMGGFGAIHTGLARPDYFGNIIALSSALITDEVSRMEPGTSNAVASADFYRYTFGDLKALPGSHNDPKRLAADVMATTDSAGLPAPRLYMACGRQDFLIEPNRDFDRYLDSIGLAHEYVEDEGAHNWAFWHRFLIRALDWLDGPRG